MVISSVLYATLWIAGLLGSAIAVEDLKNAFGNRRESTVTAEAK